MLLLALIADLCAAPLHERVDGDRLMETVELLSGAAPLDGAPLASRSVYHPDVDRAALWLEEQLTAIEGLQVTVEPFDAPGAPGLVNLIAELPGADPEAAPVVLAAHYDSTANLDEGWDPAVDPAPGADDDASGVAAVLEAARLFADARAEGTLTLSRPLRFALFSGEEVGLLGSTAHVAGLDGDVRMALVLDPVGYNPGGADFLFFSYDARWPEEADALVATHAALDGPLELGGVDAEQIGGDRRSDHAPFWDAGVPALHVGSFPQPWSYHTMNDTIDVVDGAYLSAVAGLSVAHVEALGQPVAPIGTRTGCQHVQGSERYPLIMLALSAALLCLRRRTGVLYHCDRPHSGATIIC